MNAQTFLPSASLRPLVSAYMIIESGEGMTNTILPDIQMVMAFCFRGKVNYTDDKQPGVLPAAAITGIRQSARRVQYERDTATLLVKFTEAGAAAFLPLPPSVLFNHTVALDQVMHHPQALDLCEQLAEADDDLQRIALTEHMLYTLLKERHTDTLVLAAIEAIRLSTGNIRIKDLATSLYISQDPFEKRFRLATGTSPKHFAGIVRLKAFIRAIPGHKHLGEAAHAFGFFDQAHFIRSFKSFTGQAPKAFFRDARYW